MFNLHNTIIIWLQWFHSFVLRCYSITLFNLFHFAQSAQQHSIVYAYVLPSFPLFSSFPQLFSQCTIWIGFHFEKPAIFLLSFQKMTIDVKFHWFFLSSYFLFSFLKHLLFFSYHSSVHNLFQTHFMNVHKLHVLHFTTRSEEYYGKVDLKALKKAGYWEIDVRKSENSTPPNIHTLLNRTTSSTTTTAVSFQIGWIHFLINGIIFSFIFVWPKKKFEGKRFLEINQN